MRAGFRVAAIATAALLLGGCVSFTQDNGFSAVEKVTREKTGKQLAWARSGDEQPAIEARVAELLAGPLTVDDAVQVALLNNKGLQASFFELGIGEADLVQAGRLPNPGFVFTRHARGDELEIERGLFFNLARLLAMPLKIEMETRRFDQVRTDVTLRVLALAAETRRAYFVALAAEESVRYMAQVRKAADASEELARRMLQAGNWSKLQQAREQGFAADAGLNAARAERSRTASREKLTRLMGLWGVQAQFTLPPRLPDLPATVRDTPDVEQMAMAQRLDLQAARMGTEALAKNLGLTRITGFVNVIEIGVTRETSNSAPVRRGYEIGIELPIFDWGDARVAKAESLYMQALAKTGEVAVNARSEVREAYLGYRAGYEIARHYRDEVVPARKRIADENLLRYNGMLIGVFELLADARSQIASVNGYVEALRDFWIAEGELQMAMIGPAALGNAPAAAVAASEPAGGH
jgi:outer membrane protein TolC